MKILSESYIDGLSLLGGEPLEPINQKGLVPLVKRAKEEFPEKDIWCWTGYRFDADILEDMYIKNKDTKELMKYIDIIVDGQFEIENKLVDLTFRGSINQRKIDVKQSIKNNKIALLKFGDESRYEKRKPKIMYFEEFKKSNNSKQSLTKELQNSTIPVGFGQITLFDEAEENQKQDVIIKEEIVAAKSLD